MNTILFVCRVIPNFVIENFVNNPCWKFQTIEQFWDVSIKIQNTDDIEGD